MQLIPISIIILSGLGSLLAAILAVAAKKLAVKQIPFLDDILEILPHLDCGACGFGSCANYARNLAAGNAPVERCSPGGPETMKKIAEILNLPLPQVGQRCAVVHCGADASKRKARFAYHGIDTCQAANILAGGHTTCPHACLGFGDCQIACPFDAIEMVDGLPRILLDRCTACAKCAQACPRKLITIEEYTPESGLIAITCSSLQKGRDTRKLCEVGCIACKICEKQLPDLFRVEDNLARIDYNNFTDVESCQAVIDRCPTHCIAVVVPQRATPTAELLERKK